MGVILLKRILSLFFTLAFAYFLTACSISETPKPLTKEGIAPYVLSDDTQYVLESFGMSDTSQIFSCNAPKEAITLHANVYRLTPGFDWETIGGGSISIGSEREPIEKLKGSVTLQLRENYTIDLNLNFSGRCSFTSNPIELEEEPIVNTHGFLQEFQTIELNTEIPIAIMVYDSGNSMRSYSPQDYFTPSVFDGMDLVQIVTLEFSDKEF